MTVVTVRALPLGSVIPGGVSTTVQNTVEPSPEGRGTDLSLDDRAGGFNTSPTRSTSFEPARLLLLREPVCLIVVRFPVETGGAVGLVSGGWGQAAVFGLVVTVAEAVRAAAVRVAGTGTA